MGELDGWRWCPRCRTPLAREPRAVRCHACALAAYAKPAPAVCALVLDDAGRVLLGRRAHAPYAGRWDILGGFMHEGEQPLETLRREVREETGLEVEPEEFVGAISDRYGEDGNFTLNLCWTARLVAGTPRPSDDVSALAWFTRDSLPPRDEIAFANTVELLAAWAGRAAGRAR